MHIIFEYLFWTQELFCYQRGCVVQGRPNKKVDLSDIRYARIIGDKIRLGLGVKNELRINLDCLNVEDITKLQSILECNIE